MPKLLVSLTMLLSDLPHTFSQNQGIIVVTTIGLSYIFDMSDHGLVTFQLLVKSFSHIRKPLIQRWNKHSPHDESADSPHCVCIWKKENTLRPQVVQTDPILHICWRCTDSRDSQTEWNDVGYHCALAGSVWLIQLRSGQTIWGAGGADSETGVFFTTKERAVKQ